jgi:signal transduction histidine kinase
MYVEPTPIRIPWSPETEPMLTPVAPVREPASPVHEPATRAVDLFGVLAHEMRGPLHGLVASSEVLASELGADPPTDPTAVAEWQRQLAGTANAVHCRSVWLQGLVENLLCAATMQHGRFALQQRRVDLLDVLAEVAVVAEPVLRERGQRLRFRSTAHTSHVLGDHGRLSQTVMNLVLNASKFSPPNTVVSVVVARQKRTLRVIVGDRGIGVPEHGADRLFVPFLRGENAAGRSEGLGLGLALVKAIVDAHGGAVGAERRPRSGSRFWIELPLYENTATRPC